MPPLRVAIVPGNGGGGNIRQACYYGWLEQQLQRLYPAGRVQVALSCMPDPYRASQKVWLPFMESKLGCGPDTVIVGHSSGAAAAMRFAETHVVAGLVLVGAYVSDLGDANEAASGYFNRPWQWAHIKANAGFILQFGSHDDPFLPWHEQAVVAEGLGLNVADGTLFEFASGPGHFTDEQQPEVLAALQQRLDAALSARGS